MFYNSLLVASTLLLPCHWHWDIDYDDEEAQADGHDAEESSQSSQSPSPVHVPVLQAVPGHDGVDQCHNADGPHGAKAGADDQDEVVLGFGCLLDSGITSGGAAQAGPGRGQGRGCCQVSSRTGPHRDAVSILVSVQALVSTRVERGGRLHPIAPWFSGNSQQFLCLMGVCGLGASSTFSQVGLLIFSVCVDGHGQVLKILYHQRKK